ncbi:MAG: alkaline phosphatase [Sphaerochaetaceae bacterium]|nr:alkaline phosphatase [Sphaerochaetaceae bacterium]
MNGMKVKLSIAAILLVFLVLLLVFSACSLFTHVEGPAVIFVIGDGMGQSHIDAASIYLEGQKHSLSFEQFPVQGTITTHSAASTVTDSAAAATAFATGQKVYNGVVSVDLPGSGAALTTIVEYYQERGLSVGAVTSTAVTHATPAAFLSHSPSRNAYRDIADQYFHDTRADIIMGGEGESYGILETLVMDAGYLLPEFQNLPYARKPIAFFQGDGHLPYEYDVADGVIGLSEMTASALASLEDSAGFFLLVEGGRIDHAAHSNDLRRMIGEVQELNTTVELILDWAASRDNVTLIVSADHETGGLEVNGGAQEIYPDAFWSTGGHTATPVPFFVWGAGADLFSSVSDNTDFFDILVSLADHRYE